MSTESIILLITTILAVLKAFFEWKKAQAQARKAEAESARAEQAEDVLKHTIQSVEVAKNSLDNTTKFMFTENMKKYIEEAECSKDIVNHIVKEVTEGPGDIRKHTMKFNKSKL